MVDEQNLKLHNSILIDKYPKKNYKPYKNGVPTKFEFNRNEFNWEMPMNLWAL